MTHIRPILGLIILTTLIPELFTGSTSIDILINPAVLWGYLIGYGIAILFLREIATRFSLSYGGIFILGMAYSFFNEGLLAKTYLIFQDDPVNKLINLPVDFLANMGNFFGLNFGFTLTSAVWHGIGSMLIPICIIHYLYPKSAMSPWLSKKVTAGLGVLLALAGTTTFFSPEKIQGTNELFFVIVLCMALLFILALWFKKDDVTFLSQPITKPTQPVLLGLSVGIFYLIILNILGTMGNLVPYLVVFCLGVGGYITILKQKMWVSATGLIFFGIGFYAQTLIIPLLFLRTPVNIVTAIIAYIILGVVFVGLRRRQIAV
jgi:hypothetical protein